VPAPAPLLPERRRARREEVTVARALGSTTRAGIYEHLRESGTPLTVRDVAGVFELHPNVARTHLELLADAGLVTVGRRKHPGGGRPAKVYAARDEAAADAIPAAPGGHAEGPGAELVVRLLVALLEDRGGAASSQAARAHEVAVAEGRRLVVKAGTARPARPTRDDVPTAADDEDPAARIEAAARIAVAALRPVAPAIRTVRTGADFADIAGIAGALAALAEVRPALVDPLARGLAAGAFAAAGATVSLADAPGASAEDRVLRARLMTPIVRGAAIAPAGSVDARGGQREAGVVRAMRAVTELRSGDVLEVLAEGPGSPAAFARWADRAGHQLLGVERATDDTGRAAIRLLIRKGA
jgi:TusA-related sulfurtransferase/DNA-binding transcriptional ArsR family regulator